jgi:hypothetical protein
MKIRNERETDPGICHSHDFCDANEVMLEAFKVFIAGDDVMTGIVTGDRDTVSLWNKAWDYATRNYLGGYKGL